MDTATVSDDPSAPAVAASRTAKKRRFRVVDFVGPVVFFGVFVLAWQLLANSLKPERKFLVPSPGSVWRDGFVAKCVTAPAQICRPDDTWVYSRVWSATLQTVREAGFGLLIAMVIGIGLAVLMSQARWIERSIFPWAVALQTIPILALVPFIKVRYGVGFNSRLIVCVIIAVFPIVTNTLFGLQSAEEGHHDLFTLHHAGRFKRLWKLQLPGALPAIFTGLRISAGLSVVGAIVGEFFFRSGETGIGHMIETYRARTQYYPSLFATVITACLLGVVVFLIFSVLASATTKSWYEPAGSNRD